MPLLDDSQLAVGENCERSQSGAAAARPMGGAGAREHETMRITPGCPTVLATMDADTGCPGHDLKHVLDLPAAV